TQARLAAAIPGALDELALAHHAARLPGPGEVELRIEAAGVNFIDVLKALGAYPDEEAGAALGAECAATVVAVGAGVDRFAPGDAVVAITPSFRGTGLLATTATVPARFVAPRPAGLGPVEAAGLPIAYLTAHHAIVDVARVRPGERVLLHAATGGVGLAALHVCRAAGAEVIATAGSEAKRALLRGLGVEHVFDSRDLSFVDGVFACTGGRGVDVVLNSLAGAALTAGLDVLAPGG